MTPTHRYDDGGGSRGLTYDGQPAGSPVRPLTLDELPGSSRAAVIDPRGGGGFWIQTAGMRHGFSDAEREAARAKARDAAPELPGSPLKVRLGEEPGHNAKLNAYYEHYFFGGAQ